MSEKRPSTSPASGPVRDVLTLLDEAADTLRFFSAAGCREAICSDQSLKTVASWERPAIAPKSRARNDAAGSVTFSSVADMAAAISTCTRCSRCQDGPGFLIGQGPQPVKLMFVAGWPSAAAVAAGHPLVGPDGGLLEKIINAMNLSPAEVYITHVVKGCGTSQLLPSEQEAAACQVFLEQEIKMVAPVAICALGAFTTRALLGRSTPFTDRRGAFHDRHGVMVMPTWHPMDIVSRQDRKRDVWADVQKIMKTLPPV